MSRSAFQALQNDDIEMADTPMYTVNTSDDDEDQSMDGEDIQTTQRAADSMPPVMLPHLESKYVVSNFMPNNQNTVFGPDYLILGLKPKENLIVKGQFTMVIQRGAVDINGVIYHSGEQPMKFINPLSNSIPLIQATQVIDSSKVNNKQTDENEHLFTPNYKSVIKIINMPTGLEDIGRLCPLFKNLLWNFSEDDDDDFYGMTFQPVIRHDNTVSVLKYKNWLQDLQQLTQEAKDDRIKVMVVGGKNAGKSTFLRLLIQHILSSIELVHVMDLDPGQPEFSSPDCISLSNISEVQHGNHLSLTSTAGSFSQYVGFNSPKDQPRRYNQLVESLIHQYEQDGALKHESLLINTPGWIKGYGLELTKSLISRLKPTHIVYLNNGSMDLELKIPKDIRLITVQGSYSQGGRYSSSQLRVFKTLGYFHKLQDYKFDFQPMLFKQPLQVSYNTVEGIAAIVMLGDDTMLKRHLEACIEGTIVALYTARVKDVEQVDVEQGCMSQTDLNTVNPELLSLAMVHSIDREKKLMTIYTPQKIVIRESYTSILVRGSTELPIWEMASMEVLKKFRGQSLPYISFEKTRGLERSWKMRKNVHRRGQM